MRSCSDCAVLPCQNCTKSTPSSIVRLLSDSSSEPDSNCLVVHSQYISRFRSCTSIYSCSRASSPSNSHGLIYVHASLSFSTDLVNVVGLTTCYSSLIRSNSSALDGAGLLILVLRNTSKITVKTNNRIWGGKLASVINVGLFASE